MDPLQAEYESQEDIPEDFRELYEERGGKYLLTKIQGIRTDADIDRLNRALRQEKSAHAETRERLAPWAKLGDDPKDILSKLDRIEELEAAANGSLDESKLEEMAERRIKAKLAPIERERQKIVEERDALMKENQHFKERETRQKITGALLDAASKSKVGSFAIPDIKRYAGDFEIDELGEVVTKDDERLDPLSWFSKMQPERPHWWGTSVGGNAQGGSGKGAGGKNPWSREHWSLTEQGKFEQQHGTEKASKMAKAAGSSIDATSPPPARG